MNREFYWMVHIYCWDHNRSNFNKTRLTLSWNIDPCPLAKAGMAISLAESHAFTTLPAGRLWGEALGPGKPLGNHWETTGKSRKFMEIWYLSGHLQNSERFQGSLRLRGQANMFAVDPGDREHFLLTKEELLELRAQGLECHFESLLHFRSAWSNDYWWLMVDHYYCYQVRVSGFTSFLLISSSRWWKMVSMVVQMGNRMMV